MIKSIRLKNYKGFKDSKEIEIRPITLLLGKNSSGKSSICKFFPILRDALSIKVIPFPLVSREGVRLAWRYQDLFHNQDYTNLGFEIKDDKLGILESSFYWDGKNFLNKELSCNGTIQYSLSEVSSGEIFEKVKKDNSPFINYEKTDSDFKNHLINIIPEVTFIGPIRAQAPDYLMPINNVLQKDSNGYHIYSYLLESLLNNNNLIEDVNNWMRKNMEGQEFQIEETDILFRRFTPFVKRGKVRLHLSEVGEGVTQVLPIITQSFVAQKGEITVLEQPALHLHPSVHASVAQRLAISAKEKETYYVIESHSRNLMLGFIKMVASKNSAFSKDDIAIYFIDSDQDPFEVEKIDVDDNGDLSFWPTGVFEESAELIEEIMMKE